MVQEFIQWITENEMIAAADGIVVGISGGADSVCLLKLLCELRRVTQIALQGVHVNHMIRGDEALRDEEFVRELCDAWEVPLIVVRKPVIELAKQWVMSVEEAGRRVRYTAMEKIRQEKGFERIAVAHHKDDLAETILFRMARGTGRSGIEGMSPVNGAVIRPLLFATKTDIKEYLAKERVPYCEDSTNRDLHYARNHIRQIVVPAMMEINKEAVSHIVEFSHDVMEVQEYLMGQVQEYYCAWAKTKQEQGEVVMVELPVEKLRFVKPIIQKELLRLALKECSGWNKDVGRQHIMQGIALLEMPVGKEVTFPGGMICRRTYHDLQILKKESTETEESRKLIPDKIPVTGTMDIVWGNDVIKLTMNEYSAEGCRILKKKYTKQLDCDKIKNTLCIRTMRDGDEIVMDSGGSHKKLNRYFIDRKIPKELRKTWPLLADGEQVIWIIGERLNEEYKISGETTRIVEINIQIKGEHDGENG